MTHFNWSIDYLQKYSSLGEHSNIVYKVGYTCVGINTSGTLSMESSTSGSVSLNTENLVDPVAYADLTEDVVIGWLSGVKTSVETKIEGNININDETVIKTMPWN
tara:strand:+ start:310 stop:624 length:315 start_codon:yes stop_codon:yes gene_type:complete